MVENDSVPGYVDRAKELQATGMTRGVAVNTALLEERIARWPSEWGNELHIQIYGDFEPPPSSLHFPELGITIEPDVVKSSPIITATCIVNAHVTVSEKSIKGIVDASSRIDILLGLLAAIDWGNAGNGWWCHLTHEPMGGVSAAIEQSVLEKAIKVCDKLDPRVKRKVASALYWMREPRRMTHVVAHWGTKSIHEIKKRDVSDLVSLIAQRNAHAGHRLLKTLKTFFRWCVGRAVIDFSPAEGLSSNYRETSRDRVLTDQELAAIILGARQMPHPYGGIVEFLALYEGAGYERRQDEGR